ncbi:MAG TPA: CDP-glycerol glycerophosphotransferase family protein [bacterium]|nr:CDP-glycerol glycerophosphotransferase family protein [bacterium]HOL35532.1 CDP-glycerol glycerophosphotransferase family protein [bacterium]HPP09194.1 CDP-glycerol glycerophosphotransferase family protein [bacterium]
MKNIEIFQKSKREFQSRERVKFPEHCRAGICITVQEVNNLLEKNNSQIQTFICFSPQATAACKLKNLPYFNIEEFYDSGIFLELDETMLQYQKNVFIQLDWFLQEKIKEFKHFDFTPAENYSFFLKVLCDMVFRACIGLSHLMTVPGLSHVYFFPSSATKIDPTLFIGLDVYRKCLPIFCERYGIEYTICEVSGDERNHLKNPVRQFVGTCRRKLKNSISRLRTCHSQYLVFKPGYDVDEVIEIFQKNRFPVVTLESITDRRKTKSEFKKILNKLQPLKKDVFDIFQKNNFFTWAGVDCFSVILPYLNFWYEVVIPQMYASFVVARDLFKRHRPSGIFLFSPWEVHDFGVLHAAKFLGIPRILYQHGGFEGICEYTCYDLTELRQCDYRFVYGNGVADYFNERKNKMNEKSAELVPVGSARLDRLRMKMFDERHIRGKIGIPDNKTVVCYIPTSYQYHWYMCREAYLSCSYFEFLYQLCDIFSKFPNIQFVYKPFPEFPEDPMAEMLALRVKNCKVVKDISVPEIISSSNAVIIDIPSTALLEAMLTDRPLLVFADSRFITLLDKARQLLKKRAIVAEKPEDFYSRMTEFLSSIPEVLKRPDCSFVKEYGTYLDDGKSAERAFNKIMEIINNYG